MNKVKQFIYENWDGTLRSEPKDRESLIGLPYPYTVPRIKDYFNELYYWDTYFTNVGLILSNKPEYAKNNATLPISSTDTAICQTATVCNFSIAPNRLSLRKW